jgi:hypothetical protein
LADPQRAAAAPEIAHRQPELDGPDVGLEPPGRPPPERFALAAAAQPGGPRPGALPPGAMGAAALLAIQRAAGNRTAATLVRGMSTSVAPGRRSSPHVAVGSGGTAARPATFAVQRLAPDRAAIAPDRAGGASDPSAEAPDERRAVEAPNDHRATDPGGGSEGGRTAAPGRAGPTEAAEAAKAGADSGARAAVAEPGQAQGDAGAEGGAGVRKVDAAEMDEQTAALVADFLAQFGSRLDEVKGPAAVLADPKVRRAAGRLVPDREELVTAGAEQAREPRDEATSPLSPAVIQREPPGTGTVPTRKVKVSIPDWPKIPLFKDRNVGSWFLLSGVVESPTYEGEAKPPDAIRDDTTEQELQLTADGKVKGYAATFHKETLAKTGNTELEGKVAVEVTDESVKVSGLSLKLPDLGGSSNVLLEGQFDFDLLEWPAGEPPGVMVLSYTQKIGLKSSFTVDGWAIKGQLSLPLKVSIKPNPAKVAEYVARVIGPRLAVAAPAGLAIGAPLVAGGVCIALWVNAIRAGQDIAKALDSAKLNTLGYVTAYFNTIMGYTSQRYANEGSAAGKAAAQKVLDGLRWGDLPAGAQEKIRAEYIDAGTMDLAGVQASMWKQYRAAAIAWYRKEHEWDAWAYDKGLPSDLHSLITNLDIVGPPWPVSAY